MHAPSPQRSVLIIDDDPGILRSIGRTLEHHGYRVHRAESGEDGVRQWQFHRPEVTLCDLGLPGISGMAVLEQLKTRHAVVIVFSGQGRIEDAVQAMRQGAETFLAKPIEMDHLLQAVERASEKAHLMRVVLDLRTRPSGIFQIRNLKVLVIFAIVSVLIGLAIGKGWDTEQTSPPPPYETSEPGTTPTGRP
jgi:DNA-binding NtrC family response regulator